MLRYTVCLHSYIVKAIYLKKTKMSYNMLKRMKYTSVEKSLIYSFTIDQRVEEKQ